MPVLNLSLGIGSGEDISGFVVVVFGSPQYVREGSFVLTGDSKRTIFFLGVEDLHSAVLTSSSDVLILWIELD